MMKKVLRLSVILFILCFVFELVGCDAVDQTTKEKDNASIASFDNTEEILPLEETNTFPIESQCGPLWDLQHVDLYDGTLGVSTAFVSKHQRRVGYHVGHCTGTLISDDLFISAGHCEYAVGDIVRFNYQNDSNGKPRPTRDFTVGAVIEQENNANWDYAIVRLNGDPGIEFGHAVIAPIDPPAGSHVTIIQHPDGEPKQVHAGPIVDYSSSQGANWFRHEVDTTGGSSGSGVLDDAGRIIGIHTNAGCATGVPVNGNSAIRMSQLINHSPTLQELSRSRIMWQHDTGSISLWSMNPDGTLRTYREHGPYSGWSPVNTENNRVLWRHDDGRISLWTINGDGDLLSYREHGPFDGWTPINYANNRILWQHTNGSICLWIVDDNGERLSYKVHGPFTGWTPLSYANNRILWQHTNGSISFWLLDDNGNRLSYKIYGPFTGWTAVSYYNAEVFWIHEDGRSCVWSMDETGKLLSYRENGPFSGWTPIANADGHLLWGHTDGHISYWNTGSDGELLDYIEHGPFQGWQPVSITGGRP